MGTGEAARIFLTLGQSNRLAVFLRVVGAGPEGHSLERLSAELAINPASLTLHLRSLEQAGLIATLPRPRSARSPAFVARMERCLALTDWLSGFAAQGGWPERAAGGPVRGDPQ